MTLHEVTKDSSKPVLWIKIGAVVRQIAGKGGGGDEMEVETTHPDRMSKKSELVSVLCTVPSQSRVSVQNTLAGRSLRKSEECSRINLPTPCDRLLPH